MQEQPTIWSHSVRLFYALSSKGIFIDYLRLAYGHAEKAILPFKIAIAWELCTFDLAKLNSIFSFFQMINQMDLLYTAIIK